MLCYVSLFVFLLFFSMQLPFFAGFLLVIYSDIVCLCLNIKDIVVVANNGSGNSLSRETYDTTDIQ